MMMLAYAPEKPSLTGKILCRLPFVSNTSFTLHSRNNIDRIPVENYIHDKFLKIYDARIEHFLPYLLSLKCLDKFSGAVGIRPAETGPLFLEQYLTQPVEQEIGLRLRHEVSREHIVELGNLVSARRGSNQLLFTFLAALLGEVNREWVVFTATREVEKLLGKMNFNLIPLCSASADKLTTPEQEWGSYYRHSPRVLLGYVPGALAVLRRNLLTSRTLNHFSGNLAQVVEVWFENNE